MKKSIIAALTASLLINAVLFILPAQTRTQPASAAQTSEKEISLPDPYRPSYDLWGNQWSYDGKLLHAVCPNVPDPISGKDNPECPKPKKAAPKPVTNKSVQCDVGK